MIMIVLNKKIVSKISGSKKLKLDFIVIKFKLFRNEFSEMLLLSFDKKSFTIGKTSENPIDSSIAAIIDITQTKNVSFLYFDTKFKSKS